MATLATLTEGFPMLEPYLSLLLLLEIQYHPQLPHTMYL